MSGSELLMSIFITGQNITITNESILLSTFVAYKKQQIASRMRIRKGTKWLNWALERLKYLMLLYKVEGISN